MGCLGKRWRRAWFALAALSLSAACGRVSDQTTATDDAGFGGSAGLGAMGLAGDVEPAALALDTSDCGARVVSDCEGVRSEYTSDDAVFDATPALAQCSTFNSYDGCESLEFTFDAEGCAASVTARGAGQGDVLPQLRQCLRAALEGARWPCLAGGRLRYDESCFIR